LGTGEHVFYTRAVVPSTGPMAGNGARRAGRDSGNRAIFFLEAAFRCSYGENMKNLMPRTILVLALGASSMLMAARAMADEWPLVPGNYWEVTGVKLKDGGGLAYANFIAGEWRENQEFAKSKGWIKGYMVFTNTYPRTGEPDLYLVTVSEDVASAATSEKRQDEYMAWRKKTLVQMQKESGNRAEFREVISSSLLQEMTFRN
jgi:hypothetical protein